MVKRSTTLRVTISGSFKATDNEIESFDKVTGIIPRVATQPTGEDRLSKAEQMIIKRYASIWIQRAKKVNSDGKEIDELKYKRVQKVRQVFIDSIEDNDVQPDGVLSYVGKDIMDMNFEELQDLATAKDLSAVPLYRVNSLQHARRVAFSEYAIKVLGLYEVADPKAKKLQNLYDFRVTGFNPSRFEAIHADDELRVADDHVATPEETLDRENMALQGKAEAHVTDPRKSKLTLEQLRAIADGKNITYTPQTGWDALYKKIYGAAKKAA